MWSASESPRHRSLSRGCGWQRLLRRCLAHVRPDPRSVDAGTPRRRHCRGALRADTPAVVNLLTNDVTVTAAGFRATVIDLAARGWLRILPPEDDLEELARVRPAATAFRGDALRPHERLVLQHVMSRFTTDRAIPARYLAIDIRGCLVAAVQRSRRRRRGPGRTHPPSLDDLRSARSRRTLGRGCPLLVARSGHRQHRGGRDRLRRCADRRVDRGRPARRRCRRCRTACGRDRRTPTPTTVWQQLDAGWPSAAGCSRPALPTSLRVPSRPVIGASATPRRCVWLTERPSSCHSPAKTTIGRGALSGARPAWSG